MRKEDATVCEHIKMEEIFIHYLVCYNLLYVQTCLMKKKTVGTEEMRKILRFCDDTAI